MNSLQVAEKIVEALNVAKIAGITPKVWYPAGTDGTTSCRVYLGKIQSTKKDAGFIAISAGDVAYPALHQGSNAAFLVAEYLKERAGFDLRAMFG